MSYSCNTSSDCEFNMHCSNGECVHDPIWPPNAVDIIVYIFLPFFVAVANVGGIGGGIVKMPILVLILNYMPKEATFLSYCLLFGGCLANSTLLLFKKHPTKDKPIIDYNITLIINPTVLLGTNIGIFLNVLLPEIAAGILFILFLLSICPYLYKKGMNLLKLKRQHNQLKQENTIEEGDNSQVIIDQEEQSKEVVTQPNDNQYDPLISSEDQQDNTHKSSQIEEQIERNRSSSYFAAPHKSEDNNVRNKSVNGKNISLLSAVSEGQPEDLENFLQLESKQIPWNKLGLLIGIFLTVQFFVLLRGGKGLKSFVGITTCSPWYWITCAALVVIALIASYIIRRAIVKWEEERKQIIQQFNLQEQFADDFNYTPLKTYLKIWVAGLGAGCLAGTFGVGAGLALVPLLLSEGIHPQVVAATCGFNYFFISSTTIIQVFTNNYLDLYQILLYCFLAFIGGFFIASHIYKWVDQKKAGHIIAFIVVALAILNIISYVIYLIRKSVGHGVSSLVNQSPFCSQ